MVNKKISKSKYSLKVGARKTLKNVSIMFLIPALIYLLNSYKNFISDEHIVVVGPVAGAVSYFLKNYLENR